MRKYIGLVQKQAKQRGLIFCIIRRSQCLFSAGHYISLFSVSPPFLFRGNRLPSPPCLFRICLCISAFCLDEKGCWRTSILWTHIHDFLHISHLFHVLIVLSYLILDFLCLTLLLADTNRITKYASTYIQKYTHTRTHKNKKHKK